MNTTTKRRARFAVAITGGAAILVTGTVLAVSSSTKPAAPEPVPTVPAAAVESACGLAGSGSGTEAANAATWVAVGAFMLPLSETDGPGVRTDTGPWSCFTRSPAGAVLAGVVIPWRAAGAAENWQDVIRTQTLPGAGQDTALAKPLDPAELVTMRGYDVAAYSADRATVRYYLHTPAIDASCTEELAWSDGDWKLVLGDDGSTSSGCSRGAPDNFTPWGP